MRAMTRSICGADISVRSRGSSSAAFTPWTPWRPSFVRPALVHAAFRFESRERFRDAGAFALVIRELRALFRNDVGCSFCGKGFACQFLLPACHLGIEARDLFAIPLA